MSLKRLSIIHFIHQAFQLPPTSPINIRIPAIHFANASGTRKALKTRSAGALNTRCNLTVPVIFIFHHC